ncbi:dystrophia myotonica WD repeat-containing protein-like isoform X1 [Brassica napus]|uniref:dystrophia myotonica WD repeat-containing protein-like isoform X2 n=1 Tax=Brassica napus TaxID=3708 RepID=UPI0020788ED2|nr:dystrophia myotonica WD repeat-containing protein-like isoform X2 [Brassica napus]XP_048633959.1 dystrophia myotonica WD repeat-containing protein-like isoform X1 [Brassica napus]
MMNTSNGMVSAPPSSSSPAANPQSPGIKTYFKTPEGKYKLHYEKTHSSSLLHYAHGKTVTQVTLAQLKERAAPSTPTGTSSGYSASSGFRSATARLLGTGNGNRALSFVGGNGSGKNASTSSRISGSFAASNSGTSLTNTNFDGKGTYLVFNVGDAIFICDLNSQDKDPVKSIHFSNSNPMCHAFDLDAKDGHDLLIGLNSGDVYTVSLRQQLQDVSKKLVGALHYNKDGSVNNSRCTSIAWVPGGDGAFVVAHADGNLYVYEKNKDSATDSTFPAIRDPTQFSVDKAKNSKSNPVARWHICQGSINSIAFSNDGSHLATVGRDGYLRIFDFSTQKLICGGKSYYGALLCCSWSMDGKYILTGGEDDLVQVWSMDDRKVVAWGEGHNSWVSGVAFDSYWSSPNTDGSGEHIMYRFGSVGQDTQILLWDLEMDEIVVPLRRPPGGSPTYSTGSQSAHWDNVIPVGTLQPAPCKRDVPKLSPVIAHRVHTEPLSGLMFTQESVVTACREGHLKIWTRPSASETQANSSEANPAISLLSTSFPKDNKGSLSSKIGGSSLKS